MRTLRRLAITAALASALPLTACGSDPGLTQVSGEIPTAAPSTVSTPTPEPSQVPTVATATEAPAPSVNPLADIDPREDGAVAVAAFTAFTGAIKRSDFTGACGFVTATWANTKATPSDAGVAFEDLAQCARTVRAQAGSAILPSGLPAMFTLVYSDPELVRVVATYDAEQAIEGTFVRVDESRWLLTEITRADPIDGSSDGTVGEPVVTATSAATS